MLGAKDQFIELINYLFFLGLVIGAIVLVVTLGGVGFLISIMQKFVPFSFIGFIFFVVARIAKKRQKVIERGNIPEENINYFSPLDRVLCFLMTFVSPIVILIIGRYLGGSINPGDIAQMIAVFLIVNIWHLILFNKNNLEKVVFLTNADEAKDMMMICYISIATFFFSDFKLLDWQVDVAQVLASFGVFYLMHKFIFRKRVR